MLSRRSLLTGATVGATTCALHIPGAGSAEAAVMPRLRRGSAGWHVTQLQQRLSANRFWCGKADGGFGHLTEQAVWAFQKAAGLPRDGVMDTTDWRALYNGVRARPRSTKGTLIEVNLGRQLLMVVTNGQLRWAFNTSTGGHYSYTRPDGTRGFATTPTGSYTIYSRYTTGWQNGSLGSMWRPAYWYRGWAIHGSTDIPPYPASHGCCRLSTAGTDYLYAAGLVPVGRRVWVY